MSPLHCPCMQTLHWFNEVKMREVFMFVRLVILTSVGEHCHVLQIRGSPASNSCSGSPADYVAPGRALATTPLGGSPAYWGGLGEPCRLAPWWWLPNQCIDPRICLGCVTTHQRAINYERANSSSMLSLHCCQASPLGDAQPPLEGLCPLVGVPGTRAES